MEEGKKCSACGVEITDETRCTCKDNECCKHCTCPPDCTCGCKNCNCNKKEEE